MLSCNLCRRPLVPLFTHVDAHGDEVWSWCVQCDGLGYDPGAVMADA